MDDSRGSIYWEWWLLAIVASLGLWLLILIGLKHVIG